MSVQWIAYYIAFGAHGPRAMPPPGEGWKVAAYTAIGVGVSFLIFATIRSFARAPPDTMTKEYQEATNEYLKVCYRALQVYTIVLVWERMVGWVGGRGSSSRNGFGVGCDGLGYFGGGGMTSNGITQTEERKHEK